MDRQSVLKPQGCRFNSRVGPEAKYHDYKSLWMAFLLNGCNNNYITLHYPKQRTTVKHLIKSYLKHSKNTPDELARIPPAEMSVLVTVKIDCKSAVCGGSGTLSESQCNTFIFHFQEKRREKFGERGGEITTCFFPKYMGLE